MGHKLTSILKMATTESWSGGTLEVHSSMSDLARPERLEEILNLKPPSFNTVLQNSWNAKDCSENITVKDEGLAFRRQPVAKSTDCVRGRVGYTHGLHAWEITWPKEQRGTHAVVGVATSEAPLHVDCYTALVGSNSESWGWDIVQKELHHESKVQPTVPYPQSWGAPDSGVVPDTLLVVLDMDDGTLGYVISGKYMGVAFHGLKGKTLYPIISAVWGQCEVRIRYVGGLTSEPHSLTHLCRQSIHNALKEPCLQNIEKLPLPTAMKRYLMYQ
ncbi:SPRY domain-containing SOCS box protein 2 [Protopterus annectens]|uniref:SPRY domain-containing SOCS box protein 2 n=1 Tax=Protopterus annectens TaxID=7888 RepID=UPI001CF95144|nr:SPRY domain-containing SOCS box protein 2 [Protopterus annectens]